MYIWILPEFFCIIVFFEIYRLQVFENLKQVLYKVEFFKVIIKMAPLKCFFCQKGRKALTNTREKKRNYSKCDNE